MRKSGYISNDYRGREEKQKNRQSWESSVKAGKPGWQIAGNVVKTEESIESENLGKPRKPQKQESQ